jgi:hypothetical protein
MQNSVTNRLKSWLEKPYDDNMSIKGWFLFIALLSVLSALWIMVLKTIANNLKEIS